MCGIFGLYYIEKSSTNVYRSLLEGLNTLEYRGYDSAGLGVENSIIRSVGEISKLEEKLGNMHLEPKPYYGYLAHTRWATHGEASEINCHPHYSREKNFVLVHNGIINNYDEIKSFLKTHGYNFYSQTDTEVVANLLDYLYHQCTSNSFVKIIKEMREILQGSYAFLVQSRFFPDEFICCCLGSPLIVGIDKNSRYIFSSDVLAIAAHTSDVIYLKDEQYFHISHKNYSIGNMQHDSSINIEISKLNIVQTEIGKKGFAHFMEKEIFEQSQSIERTLLGRINYVRNSVMLGGLLSNREKLREAKQIIFIACGTSYHVCAYMINIYKQELKVDAQLINSSDFNDFPPNYFEKDTVCIFVSQSGETADTIVALQYCLRKEQFCVGITNVIASSLSRYTHCGVHVNAGPEIAVVSTKAYSCQLLVLYLIALLLADLKKIPLDFNVSQIRSLPRMVQRSFEMRPLLKEIATVLKEEMSMLIVGRGYNFATAQEGALKMKETAYIHAEAINAGELKHGSLALVDKHMPVFVFALRDSFYPKMKTIINQLLSRASKLYIVCHDGDDELKSSVSSECVLIPVPNVENTGLQSIVSIIPFQILAYELAMLRGINPDKPRNLAKSVTVTE